MSDTQLREATVGGYGARIRLSVDDPSLLPALLLALGPAVREVEAGRPHVRLALRRSGGCSTSSGARYSLLCDHVALGCGLTRSDALDQTVSQVDALIARHAADHVIVHAGAVRFDDAAVVFPGQSYSGKSNLAAALVRAGGSLLGDDYAALDDDGHVHPFLREPTLRADRLHAAPRWRWSERAVPVALVFVGEFQAGASFAPAQRTRALGMQSLIVHTPCARDAPSRVLRTFARALERATIWQGARGEADEAATIIARELRAGVRS